MIFEIPGEILQELLLILSHNTSTLKFFKIHIILRKIPELKHIKYISEKFQLTETYVETVLAQ